jgi:hypothetical protein
MEPTQRRFTTAVDTMARLGFLRGGKLDAPVPADGNHGEPGAKKLEP